MTDPHLGFEGHSTQWSTQVSSLYKRAVGRIEFLLEGSVATSTPKASTKAMESIASCYEEVQRHEDNDSGYVSQQTFDVPKEATVSVTDVSSVYLSEDALLEKPEESGQSCEVEKSDSVLESSVVSTRSIFDDSELSAVSTSSIIPYVEPIICHMSVNSSRESVNESLLNESLLNDQSQSTDLSVNCDLSLSSIVSTSTRGQTPKKPVVSKVNPNFSPDLFSDDEHKSPVVRETPGAVQFREKYAHEEDRRLLKRIEACMGGLFPPPSVTINQMTVVEMLNRFEENRELFGGFSSTCEGKSREAIGEDWPEIMHQRNHGLYFNRSKLSEEFEHLCLKYAERFVGAETQSTCTVFTADKPSPMKRRFSRLRRTLKSPGKRLSHLARRRITFTKDSLQSSSLQFMGSRTRQILVDARKADATSTRKSPWKKSPRKSPMKSPRKKMQSPGSAIKRFGSRMKLHTITSSMEEASTSKGSAVKRSLFDPSNIFCDTSDSNSSTSTCRSPKRATPRRVLFPVKMSPAKNGPSVFSCKKQTPVRALFPGKESPSQFRKRKRTDSGSACKENAPLVRTNSSSSLGSSQEMSEHRKKKLLWAVAEALRSQNIGLDHPQFKAYASVLARVTRRTLPNLFNNTLTKTEGSTSESMLRIARQHVFAVTRGKTVDEIMHDVKQHQQQQHVAKMTKNLGYVGPEKATTSKENPQRILQDRANILSAEKASNRSNLSSSTEKVPESLRNLKVERIRRAINFDSKEDLFNSTGIR